MPETPEIAPDSPQNVHGQPFLALAFEDDTLMLLYAAPDLPHGVRLVTLALDGICSDLTGKPKAYRCLTAKEAAPPTDLSLDWYDSGSMHGHVTGRLGFTNPLNERYTMVIGPLVTAINYIAAPGVPERQPICGIKVPLDRLLISHNAAGTPQVQLMSSVVKSRSRRPLEVLIGNDDRVLLAMRDPQSRNGLVIVETHIPGAQQYHIERITGQRAAPISAKAREYTEHRVPEQSIRASDTVWDCNWSSGDDDHYELNSVGYPISTYIAGAGVFPVKLTASNPRWIIVVRDGNDLLIGFKPFPDQD